jgi:hypothetical protein
VTPAYAACQAALFSRYGSRADATCALLAEGGDPNFHIVGGGLTGEKLVPTVGEWISLVFVYAARDGLGGVCVGTHYGKMEEDVDYAAVGWGPGWPLLDIRPGYPMTRRSGTWRVARPGGTLEDRIDAVAQFFYEVGVNQRRVLDHEDLIRLYFMLRGA